MKKIQIVVCMAFSLLAISCGKYDDTAIKDRLDGFEERLEKLEELCKETNTNMTSLQELLKAIQNNDVITGISAITKDGEVIGYTITFLNSDPITIYNGADGAAGSIPEIGVKQDEDGAYYWTIGGEWLLDENGDKVQADSGAAPRFKVEDGYWWVSYDDGKSWEQAGPASTEGSGESIFKDVDVSDDECIVFTLADGTKIVVPTSVDKTFIDFLDNTVELFCIMNWDTNGDDKLSYEEAAAVESIGTVFQKTNIISFNEFKYFTSVKRLEERAFDSCIQLRRITLPESLEEIGPYAFCNVSVLADLHIPASVNLIEQFSIGICPALVNLTVAEDNSVYDSRNNSNAIIHTATNKLLVGCNGTVIPDDIQIIGDCAFWASKIENVTIPDSVTSIERQAFRECNNLKTVNIGKGVKEWGYQVFSKASGDYYLNSDIPDSQSSDNSVFYISNMTNLTIGPDVTTLGKHAVSNCKSLKKVVIPKNVVNLQNPFTDGTTISELEFDSPIVGKELFKGMSLTKVTLGDEVESIGESAFHDCKSLLEVIGGNNVKTIGNKAFYNCWKMTSINLGNVLESIGNEAFYQNYALLSVQMPETVTSLGEKAFRSCGKLASVKMSDKIEEIKTETFFECVSLKEFNFPASLTTIGTNSFQKAGLVSIIFPKNLSQIGQGAFNNCSPTQIQVNSTITSKNYSFVNCSGELTINAPLMPSDVEDHAIDRGAFSEANFTKVIIGEGVKELPNGSFYNSRYLTDVVLPEGFETLGSWAFSGCISLKNINIPSTLTKIGDGALEGTVIDAIVIPEGITEIRPKTFRDCQSLISVTLPESLTYIGGYAFNGCTSLKEITIPKNVTKLGSQMFGSCKSYITIYCEGTEPPVLEGGLGTLSLDILKVYVPTLSVDKYKSVWGETIAKYIYPYEF